MYDRETESLWSQIMATAVTGKSKGKKLKTIPLIHTTWLAWREKHPDSLMLSEETGYQRDYDQSPYIGYPTSEVQYFPTEHSDDRYKKKQPVIGLAGDGEQKVWPLSELKEVALPLNDTFNSQPVIVNYDPISDMAWITDEVGNVLPSIRGFWFAWVAFYPNTSVFSNHPE